MNLVRVTEQTVRSIRPTLMVLVGGVALLLLITCANVSTLLITRASSRRQEVAVRTALGATRGRLRSLAIAESVTLAGLGGLAGLALGGWVLRALLPLFEESLPTGGGCLGRCACGALHHGRLAGDGRRTGIRGGGAEDRQPASPSRSSRADARSATGRTTRVRNLLLIAQIALAVVLLSTAGLMLKSYSRLSSVRPGFTADRLLTFRLALPDSAYQSPAKRAAFAGALLETDSVGPRYPCRRHQLAASTRRAAAGRTG